MFDRPSKTYDADERIIEAVLQDEANPLNRICRLIPDGSKVIDIGAGNGLLARILREVHCSTTIDGIEPDPHAASLAVEYYRKFYGGYAQDFTDILVRENYDFIILADVIEHICDPLSFLDSICRCLSVRSRIVLSIPNVAFGAVRIALLKGDFDYVDSGLLERTHVRFFTRKTVQQLIEALKVNVDKMYYLQKDILRSEIDLRKRFINPLCIFEVLKDDMAWVYQFLVVLTKDDVKTEMKFFGHKSTYSVIDFYISCLKRFLISLKKGN
jgi:2-polyprenyl-3-methyl-5-hydroxy-6-metoxy-1,4-benzoquinol methylase